MSKYRELSISILGGGGEIGANTIEVCFGSERVLLDCGVHPKKEGYESLPEFDMMSGFPDAVLVTHGHVDHCGSLPYLTRLFSHFRVHATLPTIRIMERMLHNSVMVMSTLRREKGIVEYPLYNHEDVESLMEITRAHLYKEYFEVSPHGIMRALFNPAGHVLGSASILLEIDGYRIFYTGDISGGNQELLGPYEPMDWVDGINTIIVESTQGAVDETQVNSYFDEAMNLAMAINSVVENSGSVLIPTFALGRTQEIANILARLQENGILIKVPIYISGLGRAIYEIYEQFREYLNGNSTLRPLRSFRKLGNVFDKNVIKQLIENPSIIIATSGMMVENTPSALIAEKMVSEKKHGIFFVGYVDPDTLGYKLLTSKEGDRLVFQLEAEPVEIRLTNIKRFHFSGHAYRSTLLKMIDDYHPENVIIVHGDPPALEWMREQLKDKYNCIMPSNGEKITFQL